MTCPGGCASAYPPYRSLFKLCVDTYATAPRKNRGAQESAAIEPSGAITRLTHRRDSDLIIYFL